jgi:paraquat-inducible protein A
MDMTQKLIACEECDTLYRRIPLNTKSAAYCSRCGAELYRSRPFHLDSVLALTFGSIVVFVMANAFPIVTLEMKGIRHGSTLFGAIVTLYREGMPIVSGLVLTTTVLFPFVELVALLYLLIPLRQGRRPAQFHLCTRVIQAIRPWGMIEVFLLGVVVSLVKLAHQASIVPGVALWAFGTLTVLLAAILMFDPRHLWDLAEECAGSHSS